MRKKYYQYILYDFYSLILANVLNKSFWHIIINITKKLIYIMKDYFITWLFEKH